MGEALFVISLIFVLKHQKALLSVFLSKGFGPVKLDLTVVFDFQQNADLSDRQILIIVKMDHCAVFHRQSHHRVIHLAFFLQLGGQVSSSGGSCETTRMKAAFCCN